MNLPGGIRVPTDREQKQLEERRWLDGLLVSAQKRDWYGTITIEIKKGMIHQAGCEQTLKPPSSPGSKKTKDLSDFSS